MARISNQTILVCCWIRLVSINRYQIGASNDGHSLKAVIFICNTQIAFERNAPQSSKEITQFIDIDNARFLYIFVCVYLLYKCVYVDKQHLSLVSWCSVFVSH